jgi:hypothetical protein
LLISDNRKNKVSLYSEMLITTPESSGIRRHRAYGLGPVITVVREAGLDPVAMLERAGIPADAPDDPEYTLSPREELAFMEDALQALQQPDLGLQLGPRYHLPFYGSAWYSSTST